MTNTRIWEILHNHGIRFANLYTNRPELKDAVKQIIVESVADLPVKFTIWTKEHTRADAYRFNKKITVYCVYKTGEYFTIENLYKYWLNNIYKL